MSNMWKAKIIDTQRNGERLDIIISYSRADGNAFNETISTTSAQDDLWINGQITNKLNKLNDLDIYETSVKASNLSATEFSVDVNGLISTPIDIAVK